MKVEEQCYANSDNVLPKHFPNGLISMCSLQRCLPEHPLIFLSDFESLFFVAVFFVTIGTKTSVLYTVNDSEAGVK